MCKITLLLLTGALMTALAAGCQPLIRPVTLPAATAVQSTSETTNSISQTVAIAAAGVISDAVPTLVASTAAMTNTAVTTETAAVSVSATTAEAVADTPTPEVEESTARPAPMLTVIVAALRMRSGPGTAYPVLGAADQGAQYPLVGQAYACQWYQVVHPQLGEVWLSGGAQYVATDVSCDQVAAAIIPTPQPTLQPTEASVEATVTAVPAQTQPVADPFPADQGCLILQNQLGPELTFTFTSADSSWNDSIKVNADHDIPYCFKPGTYRVTVDAPPPWPSLNLDFAIQAGYRAYFPIRPQ